MVTPLGQRMVFQTAHAEAARAAHDIAAQLQRDEAFKKVLADRMAEDMEAVNRIARSDALTTEERRERQRRSGGQQGGESGGEDEGEGMSSDGSLDFMA